MRQRKCFSLYAAMIAVVSFVVPLEAAEVLFVGDVDGDIEGDGSVPVWADADVSMVAHMSNVLGHNVTQIDDEVVTAEAVAVADYDFIVVSATSYSGFIGDPEEPAPDGNTGAYNMLLTDATIVLMESGNWIVRAFDLVDDPVEGMTGLTAYGTEIEIVVQDGYLTNGLEPGTLAIYDDPGGFGGEEIRGFGLTPPNGSNQGFPQADFTGDLILAEGTNSQDLVVVLGMHAIDDNTIIALPFGNGGFDHLTADGLQLFDNLFATPELRADFDSDGDVDGEDFLAWQRGFGTLAPDAAKQDGDANGDLGVDSFDRTIWAGAFGYVDAPSSTQAVAAVPEPSAWAYCFGLLLAGLLVFGRRQRLIGCVVPGRR